MPKDTNQHIDRESREAQLEKLTYEAMRSMGWIIPQTPEDVEKAEADLAENPVSLPEHLRDPSGVFDSPKNLSSAGPEDNRGEPVLPKIEEHLACAAREGGEIPPEVRERMEQDREQAEGEDEEQR